MKYFAILSALSLAVLASAASAEVEARGTATYPPPKPGTSNVCCSGPSGSGSLIYIGCVNLGSGSNCQQGKKALNCKVNQVIASFSQY